MIIANGLKKNYGDFQLDIDLEIPKGRVTGLVGKNGAGKSTTIKMILGLVKPDGGSLTVLGKNIKEIDVSDREKMGVALAEAGFSTVLTVEDIHQILKKMYPEFQEDLFLRKAKEMGLPTNKQIKEFSTGMRAKLRVLTAISHNAKLLILDEPTAGLDVEARNDVLDLLREYLQEDEERSILITSHISSDLEGICDDIYLIHNGKIVIHEETDVILSNYAVIKVDEAAFEALDKAYIIKEQKTKFGYVCFTNEKEFYKENYPNVVVENSGIDDLILMMTGGYR